MSTNIHNLVLLPFVNPRSSSSPRDDDDEPTGISITANEAASLVQKTFSRPERSFPFYFGVYFQ